MALSFAPIESALAALSVGFTARRIIVIEEAFTIVNRATKVAFVFVSMALADKVRAAPIAITAEADVNAHTVAEIGSVRAVLAAHHVGFFSCHFCYLLTFPYALAADSGQAAP